MAADAWASARAGKIAPGQQVTVDVEDGSLTCTAQDRAGVLTRR